MSKNTDLGNLVNGLFVSSTRNVGVGTTTPRASLDVTGNIHARQGCWTTDESLNGGFLIGDLATGTAFTYIGGVGSTGAASYLSFSTNAGEKMRITSAGRVGIGTTAPVGEGSDDIVTQIHNPASTGAARAMIRLTNGYTGSAWGNGSFITVDSSQGLYIGNSEAAPMLLFTSGAERMRINANGNFDYGGINISAASPNAIYKQAFYGALSLMWRGAEDSYINSNHTFTSSNTNVASYTSSLGIGRIELSGGFFVWNTYNGSVTAGSTYALSQKFIIQPSGNVGIGTSSPASVLQVNGAITSASGGATLPQATWVTVYTFNASDIMMGTFSFTTGGTHASSVCLFNKTFNGGSGALVIGTPVNQGSGNVQVSGNSIQVLQNVGAGTLSASWWLTRTGGN